MFSRLFLTLIFLFLSGCFWFEDNSKHDNTVTLSNFRSATSLHIKYEGLEWQAISNSNDIFSFIPKSNTFEVSLTCPFNTSLNNEGDIREQQYLYLLDSNNFTQLDLGCDEKLTHKIDIAGDDSESSFHSLAIPYNLDRLTDITYPRNIFSSITPGNIYTEKQAIDADIDREIMGVTCQDSSNCKFYYRQYAESAKNIYSNVDIYDQNFLYDMHPYDLSGSLSIPGGINYITSDHRVFPLGSNFRYFDMPAELRSNNDGFLFFITESQMSDYILSPNDPKYSFYWTSTEWWLNEIPDITVPIWQAQAKISYDYLTPIRLSFIPLVDNELTTKYYLASMGDKVVFISAEYGQAHKYDVNIAPVIYQPVNTPIERDYEYKFNLPLVVQGEFKKHNTGPANLKPQILIEDSTSFPRFSDYE
jgi:hypothetical protein